MTRWNGRLTVPDNRILGFQPINFWNKLHPVRKAEPNSLQWRSSTTGGLAGILLDLEESKKGRLIIETKQGASECELSEIGLNPLEWKFGGLNKKLEIYRIPDGRSASPLEMDFPITEFHRGDNPLYVRVHQEDGHIAWSSPIYFLA